MMTKLRNTYGPVDQGALDQITRTALNDAVVGTALMGDHHKGYGVPIGGVVAYRNAISPTGVGYDIACGNKAVRLNVTLTDFLAADGNVESLADEIYSRISFGMGQKNNTIVEHELFDDYLFNFEPFKSLKQMAQGQLGTVGGGNHYVDVFVDSNDSLWVGCHFGSRGFGHKIATYFLNAAGASNNMDAEPCVLSLDTALGSDYAGAMELAGRYAYAGRDWVCDEVARIVGSPIAEYVHNHHNFAWKEVHGGEELIVVRKGATPAFAGQRGFVGASLAEPAVILEGVAGDESDLNFNSTVHGAGRRMSRNEAKGKFDRKTGVRKSEGKVTPQMLENWVWMSGVVRRGADVDESPDCYKRLDEVLQYHANTVKIINVLRPVIACMAGDEVDPYKD